MRLHGEFDMDRDGLFLVGEGDFLSADLRSHEMYILKNVPVAIGLELKSRQ